MSIYYFLHPSIAVYLQIRDLSSPQSGISKFAFNNHRAISDEFGTWAQRRVDRSLGKDLSTSKISGTEWPMFSVVYFLWSTEELDKARIELGSTDTPRPKDYAANAIEAAAKLVVYPSNASWVIKHWGDKYLETENVFYRMLLIAGLTSYQSITGNKPYEPLLKQQVLSLSRELDQSPYGVLDDYPRQCYPIDVLPAIAVIKRAGELLDLDLGQFVDRARRGFEGQLLDPKTSFRAMWQTPARGSDSAPQGAWASVTC